MTHRTSSHALPLAVCTLAAWVGAGCSLLKPEGNGGWSDARRNEELARAAAFGITEPAQVQQQAAGGAPAAATEIEPPRTIDLATALDLAARRNRTIAASEAAVDAAAGSVAVARAALLPTNSVRGAYNWYSDEQTNSLDIDPATFPLPPGTTFPVITVREKEYGAVTAAVRLAIDLSGELRHGLGAAQASYRAEQARAWATRLEQENDVAAAYYDYLEAERLREVGRQAVALHERQFMDASARFEHGQLTRNGVLVVQVALSNARQAVVRSDIAAAAARRTLNSVTGLDIAAPTVIRDVARRPTLPTLDDAVATVSARNPLVAAMLEEVQAADERLTAARRSRLPRFSATGAYDATTAETLVPNDYASAVVGVEFDLGSFGREGEIARLKANSRRSRLLLDRTVRDVETLVRGTYDRVVERLAAIDAEIAAVGQAEENLRIRQAQFGEGRATSEDLLDASQLLSRQRAALAAATYQAHARRAELQQLMGQPLSELADTSGRPAARQGVPRE